MRTDLDLLTMLQYAVMEAPDQGQTWPSQLWSKAEVLDYVNEREARFCKVALFQLGLVALPALTDVPGEVPTIPARTSIVALPADWIATVSVVWTGEDGTERELVRVDTFEADHGQVDWTTTAETPWFYMDYATPTLQLQIGPIPDVAGRLALLYVPNPVTLTGDPDAPEPYPLPDEFADAAGKYGPLADMFAKDGRGRVPDKAAYCEARYQLGLDCAAIILGGRF